jgi:crotonobetainyl-CoA:carnitine CoA-transferase CaiB-like acyl-CoA transferase
VVSNLAPGALVQAEAGSCAITGLPGQPAKSGILVADIGTALYAYSSVLAALYERERTGRGAVIGARAAQAAGCRPWGRTPKPSGPR